MDESLKIVGLMSGTSLDGLDLVLASFSKTTNAYTYKIIKSQTITYNDELKNQLAKADQFSGIELRALDVELGRYFGQCVQAFLGDDQADAVASHGHTIFHEPNKGFTMQIADANYIAAACKLPVISDFRSFDMALGGQGAPLVPIGDELLFADYANCLNLGGIANCSFIQQDQRIAFDICPFNILLNHFANKLQLEYDDAGKIAESGKANKQLIEALNSLAYYAEDAPKSLDKSQVLHTWLPIIHRFKLSEKDTLCSLNHHFALQISKQLSNGTCLVTGGGAYNSFFIQLLKQLKVEVVVPNKELIDMKEALIFAFLGYLRLELKNNILSSVTGAASNSCAGQIIHFNRNKK